LLTSLGFSVKKSHADSLVSRSAFFLAAKFSGDRGADGKVFARPEVHAQVEIPNQQALIFHSTGVECLVIETAFLGEGTNFGWVVPLPSEPKVQPVSESFFPSLQNAFQPRLLHYVHHYYIGILFVCGLGFLAWRSFKDESVWVTDLPLCLLLAVGVGLLGRSVLIGVLTLIFTIGTRLFIRPPPALLSLCSSGCYWLFGRRPPSNWNNCFLSHYLHSGRVHGKKSDLKGPWPRNASVAQPPEGNNSMICR
jgi:hypothetical protein